jgi:hypothetical protein
MFKRPVTTTQPGGADSGAKLVDSVERLQDWFQLAKVGPTPTSPLRHACVCEPEV